MKSFGLLLTLSFVLFACQKKLSGPFDDSAALFYPLMINQMTKQYLNCVEAKEPDQIRKEVQLARRSQKNFQLIEETQSRLTYGFDPTMPRVLFKSRQDCEGYIDHLKSEDWKSHSP